MTLSPPDFGVAGKSVLVTGAARGLGRTFAESLAAAGAAVALLDQNGEGAAEVVAGIEASGGRAVALCADVTDPARAARAVQDAISAFGLVDGLVNNAGINQVAPSEDADVEQWRRVVDVNLFGAFNVSRLVGRHMLARGRGSIVGISSIHGQVAPALHAASAYAASKAGLIGLTRALAVEWGARGVRVNAIAPSIMLTEMTRARLEHPDYRAGILARSPLNVIGEPADLLGALFYLLSDASRLVTGQVLGVDAGWVAV